MTKNNNVVKLGIISLLICYVYPKIGNLYINRTMVLWKSYYNPKKFIGFRNKQYYIKTITRSNQSL